MIKMTFIGAGSYGTAVANHFARKRQSEVIIYGRNREIVDEINKDHSNSRYLGEHELSRNLKASNELQEAVSGTDFLFIAVPAQEIRNVAQ